MEWSSRNQFAALLVLVFAQPIARIVRLRRDDVTIAPDSVIVHLAGAPMQQLRPLFSSLAARLGTPTELARQTPVAILAKALGYTAATLEKHAAVSGGDYGRCVSDLTRARR
ncbi:hypothetical protein [Isoptericola sp. NPDC055881]